MRTVLVGTALGLSVGGAAVLYFVPTDFGGVEAGHVIHKTLVDVNGAWVVNLLLIPIFISFVPLVFPERVVLITATVLLWAFVVISSFTIGLFYAPAAVAVLLAASVKPRLDASRQERSSGPKKGIIYTGSELEEFRRRGL